jgi:uncharacterized protein
MPEQGYTIFVGSQVTARGGHEAVVERLKEHEAKGEREPILVFEDETGRQIDLDLRAGSARTTETAPIAKSASTAETATMAKSAAEEPVTRRGPGRPKLGVVAREVTLLPRHWEWLNAQPGGASVALRKLVENARRENAGSDRVRRSQEAAFRFMTAMAGNEPGFEEACRALYRRDPVAFEARIGDWPADVAGYARRLAADAFARIAADGDNAQ